jgi:hypothetical protein
MSSKVINISNMMLSRRLAALEDRVSNEVLARVKDRYPGLSAVHFSLAENSLDRDFEELVSEIVVDFEKTEEKAREYRSLPQEEKYRLQLVSILKGIDEILELSSLPLQRLMTLDPDVRSRLNRIHSTADFAKLNSGHLNLRDK